MKRKLLAFSTFLVIFFGHRVSAQCDTGAAPSYSSGCPYEYYTAITASGTGVVSTINFSGSSCTGVTYFDSVGYAGLSAPTGTSVSLSVTRCSGSSYTSYLNVYVDWNNDGVYETSEHVGTAETYGSGVTLNIYTFTIPLTGIVTNTHLAMRIIMTEGSSSDGPCTGTYGQTADYYLDATCSNPTLSISPASPTVCPGGTTTLTATGAGTTTPTYTWTPGTGLSATTGASVTAAPTTATTYTVTSYGPGVCIDTVSTTVTVHTAFTTTITASGPATFCPGGSVTFTTADSPGYSYQWIKGTTDIPGATTTSYSATTAGNYYVYVTAPSGCNDTSNHLTVSYDPVPSPVISASGATTFCTPGSVTLTETSGTGSTYQWFTTSGPVAGATAASFTDTMTDRDSVVVTNSFGCSDTSSATVLTAILPPVASVTPTGPVSFCPGSGSLLTASAGSGFTYQWYEGSTAIPSATAATYSATAAGSYSVVITGTGGCHSGSNIVNASLNPVPTPSITASGPLTFCAPGSVTLTESSGTGTIYQWYFDATAIAGANGVSYTASISGSYKLVLTNASGCSATSATSIVLANPTPSSIVAPPGPIALCGGGSAILSAATGAGYMYQWYNSGGPITGETGATYTATLADNYYVTVTGGDGCSATSSPVSVTVNPLPTVTTTASGPLSFCPGDSVVLTGTPGAGYSFQWYNGSGAIAGATNLSYTATAAGNYYLTVTTSAGCSATSSSFTVSLFTPPSVAVSYAGTLTFCYGDSVVISGEVVAGDTYQWYDGSGPIAGATGASYTATASGDYYAIITNTTGCSSTTNISHAVEIAAPFIEASGPASFCAGGDVVLYTSTGTGTGITYQWQKDSVNIAGATSSSYVVNTSGYYSCFVTSTASCFSATNAIYIDVHPTPMPVVSYDGYHVSTSPYYATYQWYINMVAIPGATTYETVANEIGSYRVMVTDTNACGNTSNGYGIYELGVNNVNPSAPAYIYPNPANDVLHIAAKQDVRAVITGIDGKMILEQAHAADMDISSLPSGLYLVALYGDDGNRVLIQKLVKE